MPKQKRPIIYLILFLMFYSIYGWIFPGILGHPGVTWTSVITSSTTETGKMKIKVESEKIIKAVKKLDGIEIVLENLDDAREAINLILLRAGLFEKHKDAEPKEVRVSSYQKYETTAVDYKMIFLLEFIFENDISLDTRVAVIKELQEFFSKV